MSAVRSAFWDSRVALQLSLSEDDVSAAGRPPPLFVALPYVAPLSVAFPNALSCLREYLPPGPSAPWASAGHLPLRWEYPVGVLRDLVLLAGDPPPGDPLSPPPLSPLPPHSPWRLTLHARHAEDVGLAPWRGDDSTRASLTNGLKQASFIVRGSAARVMELSRGASADLARAAAEGDLERDRAVRAGLALDPVPVRGRPARAPLRILVRTLLGARRGDARAAASPLITWSDVAVTSRGVPIMTKRVEDEPKAGAAGARERERERGRSEAGSRAGSRAGNEEGAESGSGGRGSLAHSRVLGGGAEDATGSETVEGDATGDETAGEEAAADSASSGAEGPRARVRSPSEAGGGREAGLSARLAAARLGEDAEAAARGGRDSREGDSGGSDDVAPLGGDAGRLEGASAGSPPDAARSPPQPPRSPSPPAPAAASLSASRVSSPSAPPRVVESPTTLADAVSAFLDELDGAARPGTLPRARGGADPRVATLVVGGVCVPGEAPVGGVHAALHAPDGFLYVVVGRWPRDAE